MHRWTIDYVNLNNNIFINIFEAHDNLIQVEKEILDMMIKQEINVPPLWDYISNWLKKQLVAVFEFVWPQWLWEWLLFKGLHWLYQR